MGSQGAKWSKSQSLHWYHKVVMIKLRVFVSIGESGSQGVTQPESQGVNESVSGKLEKYSRLYKIAPIFNELFKVDQKFS